MTLTGRQTKVYFIKEEINNSQWRGCAIIFLGLFAVLAGNEWGGRLGCILPLLQGWTQFSACQQGHRAARANLVQLSGNPNLFWGRNKKAILLFFISVLIPFFPTDSKILKYNLRSKNVLTPSSMEWLLTLGRILSFYYWWEYLEMGLPWRSSR